MQLLQADIERLLALIPLTRDMAVERREYNRQAAEDHAHAALFNRALFDTQPAHDTPYWRMAAAEPMHEKLLRKIAMFESRGTLVSYDLEPFAPEDWTILHYGMGRRPARHDRMADRVAENEIRQYLSVLQRDIDNLVHSMPAHADYLAGLIQFLAKQRR
jgi:tryptophan halogenase